MTHLRSPIAGAAFLAVIAAVWVHWPCVHGGFLTDMDDDMYMAAAEKYGGLTLAGVRWAFTETWEYYQPLTRLSMAGRVAVIAVAVTALVCLAVRARVDVRMWHDDETLWHSILRWYPNLASVNKRVANAAITRGFCRGSAIRRARAGGAPGQ